MSFTLKWLSTLHSSLQHRKAAALTQRIPATQLKLRFDNLNLVCEAGKETYSLFCLRALSFSVHRKAILFKLCLDLIKQLHRNLVVTRSLVFL